MSFEEFKIELEKKIAYFNIKIDLKVQEKFYEYMNLLIEWNKKMNLTSILDEKEIVLKHFIDSLTIKKYCEGGNIIDIGTGAGFPGVPIKLVNNNINLTLLDSINKRMIFLKEVINNTKLNNVNIIHGRAEDYANNIKYREMYDIAVSRAVAPMNVLVEYMLPFVKLSGRCICMKGSNIDELKSSKNAIKLLGGEIEKIDEFFLPETDIKRNNIIIRKIKSTPKNYPRKAGKPSKEPII